MNNNDRLRLARTTPSLGVIRSSLPRPSRLKRSHSIAMESMGSLRSVPAVEEHRAAAWEAPAADCWPAWAHFPDPRPDAAGWERSATGLLLSWLRYRDPDAAGSLLFPCAQSFRRRPSWSRPEPLRHPRCGQSPR